MKTTREILEERTPKIKPALDSFFRDKKPEDGASAICSKHGEYLFKSEKSAFMNKYLVHSTCISCIKERDQFIESEIIRIDKKDKADRMEAKILQCGVSKRNLNKTFSTFEAKTPEQTKAKALYEEFASTVCNGKTAKNLIVCGSVGTGKTHLASSVVNDVTHSGKTCKLIKVIDLIRQYKSTWSKDSDKTEKDFLDYYTNIEALIIDEVGVQFGSDTEKMVIFDIIDGRYNNMLPTILISNLALPDVKELIGERAIDRLREDGGQVVAMQWLSHRGNQ